MRVMCENVLNEQALLKTKRESIPAVKYECDQKMILKKGDYMSKYDVPMDTGENSSTGKIIRMMEPSSYVLEFGCAEGRMTQYMKENMNCKVYIVEIDKEAFQKAKKYAEGGICCDANTLEWKNAFDGIFFDYILFADVLEHLQNPELVLNCAVSLLKYNGMIIASIPNIGHGDVICSLLCNRFHYTSVGLLDNTHIHFWGKTDFYEMAERMGLCVVKEDAVLEKVNSTEQAVYGRRLPDTMRKQMYISLFLQCKKSAGLKRIISNVFRI